MGLQSRDEALTKLLASAAAQEQVRVIGSGYRRNVRPHNATEAKIYGVKIVN
ncbi:hypothetical protein [Methylobacterium sp.]|uniref:hypothetical protein n=1 Tax=Methylobacterium sp. TaxID=409 RepID=UPI003B001409